MTYWPQVLFVAHLIGLALGVGSSTVKLTLLVKCRRDPTFVPVFLAVARPITRHIILGLILLTVSGVGWVALGYGLTPLLVAKVVLVAAIWVLGPVIDNVVEPRFRRLAPAAGASPTPAFVAIESQFIAWEVAATLLFYVIIVMWVGRL